MLLELNQIIRNQSGFIYEVSIGEFYFAWITNAFNYTCECNSAMKRKYILKTLLIQYDIKSRNILKQLLKPYSKINVMAEVGSVEEGLNLSRVYKFDLIFLELQNENDFAFKDLVQLNSKIVLISDPHIKLGHALHLGLIDNLVKPIDSIRFDKTIKRILRGVQSEAEAINDFSLDYNSRIILKEGKIIVQIPISEISHVEAEGAYTRVRFIYGKKMLITRRISKWETLLPSNYFCRVDRFQIINLNCVNEVIPQANNLTQVSILGVAERLTIKRIGTERLRAALLRRVEN